MDTDYFTECDLSAFGYSELYEAARLLHAYSSNPTSVNLGEGIKLCFNANSGYVFLSDEDYNVAMMNGNKLEDWFICPERGLEGFREDMFHSWDTRGCRDYLRSLGFKKQDGAA